MTTKIDRPDLDFLIDLSLVDLNEETRAKIEAHVSTVLTEAQWHDLTMALAEFASSEMARGSQPTETKLRQMERVRAAAERLEAALASFSDKDLDWLMSGVFDCPAREQFRDQLARFTLLGGSRVEIPPAAPKLDADLRWVWKNVTGQDATINHSGPSSAFRVFFGLALDGIVLPELLPGDTPKSMSSRPATLEKQRLKRRKDEEALEARLQDLALAFQSRGRSPTELSDG